MKAYQILRRPRDDIKIVQHVFSLGKQNPQVAIQPIQLNQLNNIRKDSSERPIHSMERKSAHFTIEGSNKDATRFSFSPNRKKPIFSHFQPSHSREVKDSRAISFTYEHQSGKKQKDIEIEAMKELTQLISKESEKKEKDRLKIQSQSAEKLKEISEGDTPLNKLNDSLASKQKNSIISNRQSAQNTENKVPSMMKIGKQMTPENIEKDILKISIPETNSRSYHIVNSQSIGLKQNPLYSFSEHIHYDSSLSMKHSDSCGSLTDIGCCWEQTITRNSIREVQTHRTKDQNKLNRSTDYSYHRIFGKKQFTQFDQVQTTEIKAIKPPQKRIFGDYNPETVSSKVRQSLSFKQDKISSKPLPQASFNISQKTIKVNVFQVMSFEPFEF